MTSTQHFISSVTKMLSDAEQYELDAEDVIFLQYCEQILLDGEQLNIHDQIRLLSMINHTLCRITPDHPVCF